MKNRNSKTRQTADGLLRAWIPPTPLPKIPYRAEDLGIVRKIPMAGYDVTFLITHAHLTTLSPGLLCDLLVTVSMGGEGG